MKLLITQLKEGENSFHFASDQDGWMKDIALHIEKRGYSLSGPLQAQISLVKLEPDYYLRGTLNANLNQVCARCAETFSMPVHNAFEMAFAHVKEERTSKAKLSEESEEMDVTFFEGYELNLRPVIEEQFFLGLPYQALCRPGCKGICQRCGRNLNQGSCGCAAAEKPSPFSVLQNFKL